MVIVSAEFGAKQSHEIEPGELLVEGPETNMKILVSLSKISFLNGEYWCFEQYYS